MFIWSMRASSLKFIIACLLSVTVLGTLVAVIPFADDSGGAFEVGINYDGIHGKSDVESFISSFGWEIKPGEPITEEVTIPDEFDRVFVNYNEIQKRQGLDLSKYRRKTVTRYTYEITNFKNYDGTVFANVIVYRNRVIGGDICSASPDGFVCTFTGE